MAKSGVEWAHDDFMKKYGTKKPKKKKHKKSVSKSYSSNQGWENESARHSLASYGVKTGTKSSTNNFEKYKPAIALGAKGLGAGIGLAKSTGAFLAKKREDKLRKEQEREAFLDGEIRTPLREKVKDRVPFVRPIDNVIKNENYFQAQQHAKKQRLEQMNKQRLKPLDIVKDSNFSEFAVNAPRGDDKKQGFLRKRW